MIALFVSSSVGSAAMVESNWGYPMIMRNKRVSDREPGSFADLLSASTFWLGLLCSGLLLGAAMMLSS